MPAFKLRVLRGQFAVCRLDAGARIPDWATGEVVSITRTPDELSILCPQEDVPNSIQREPGWRCLHVVERLEFSMLGVIASLTSALADAKISVFVVSTYETDYLLVKEDNLTAAVDALSAAGHLISS